MSGTESPGLRASVLRLWGHRRRPPTITGIDRTSGTPGDPLLGHTTSPQSKDSIRKDFLTCVGVPEGPRERDGEVGGTGTRPRLRLSHTGPTFLVRRGVQNHEDLTRVVAGPVPPTSRRGRSTSPQSDTRPSARW